MVELIALRHGESPDSGRLSRIDTFGNTFAGFVREYVQLFVVLRLIAGNGLAEILDRLFRRVVVRHLSQVRLGHIVDCHRSDKLFVLLFTRMAGRFGLRHARARQKHQNAETDPHILLVHRLSPSDPIVIVNRIPRNPVETVESTCRATRITQRPAVT